MSMSKNAAITRIDETRSPLLVLVRPGLREDREVLKGRRVSLHRAARGDLLHSRNENFPLRYVPRVRWSSSRVVIGLARLTRRKRGLKRSSSAGRGSPQ